MIRKAREEDLSAIDYIYNQAIYAGFCTAHLHPLSEQERKEWYQRHAPNDRPVYIYEENDQVLGWVSISSFRSGREALTETAEISYYVDFRHHGQDIGSKLVRHCLQQCPGLGIRVLLAIIIDGNDASIALLEKFGFQQWGYLPEVVKYEGELRGQQIMGKRLNNP